MRKLTWGVLAIALIVGMVVAWPKPNVKASEAGLSQAVSIDPFELTRAVTGLQESPKFDAI